MSANILAGWNGKIVSRRKGEMAGPCPFGGMADHDGFHVWPDDGNFFCRYDCRHICGGKPHPAGTIGWLDGRQPDARTRALLRRKIAAINEETRRELTQKAHEYRKTLYGPEGEKVRMYIAQRGISERVAARALLGAKNHTGLWLAVPYLHSGTVWGIKLRNLLPGEPRYTMEPGSSAANLYVPLPEMVKAARVVAVCEGVLDALMLCSFGIPAAAPESGGGSIPEPEVLKFHLRSKRVVFISDRDKPGREYAQRWAENLSAAGVGCVVVEPPDGKDIGETYQIAASGSTPAAARAYILALWRGWIKK